jgi:hypothetical protein
MRDPRNTNKAVMISALFMFIALDETMVVTIFDAS